MTDRPKLSTALLLLAIFAIFGLAQFDDARQLGNPPTAAAQADHEDAEALASRDWAASQACKGQPFSWEDDKTIVCYREATP